MIPKIASTAQVDKNPVMVKLDLNSNLIQRNSFKILFLFSCLFPSVYSHLSFRKTSSSIRNLANTTYNGGSFTCPPGKKILYFTGFGGWVVDLIQGICDDGSILGPIGFNHSVPNENTTACPSGYTGGTIVYGFYTGKITPSCNGVSDNLSIGDGLGQGSFDTESFACPSGQVVIGYSAEIATDSFTAVSSFSFICGATNTKKHNKAPKKSKKQKLTKTPKSMKEPLLRAGKSSRVQ